MWGAIPWLVGATALFLVFRRTERPVWLDDLLIRAYAADRTVPAVTVEPSRWDNAAQAAAKAKVPVAWVLQLQDHGVGTPALVATAHAVVNLLVAEGPPADTQPSTLALYRDKALAAAAAAHLAMIRSS